MENCGMEGGGRTGPMYWKHEGRDDGANKSKFVAERVATDFLAWMTRTQNIFIYNII